MKILIITKSFVKEVSCLVQYAERHSLPWQFALVMPHCPEPLPASVSIRKLYLAHRMRASCYAPFLLPEIQTFRPDVLHVFEEFSGLIAFQSVLSNNLFRQKSKVMVYSAENISGNVRRVFRAPMRYVMRYSDMAFVCSQGVKRIMEQEGYTNPIEVFPLGVDTSKFYKFSSQHLKTELALDGKFILGYIGRLLTIKGVYVFIEMLQHLNENVHLLIIGSGPEEKNLKSLCAENRLDHRMHFVGNVPYSQLSTYINCIDIGVVPSRTTTYWKEQFGRVLIELMSCEVPVVGSDSGSIPEVLGNAGYLFPEDDVQALVTRIESLRHSPQTCRQLGKTGRDRVMKSYSLEVMCERFGTMYTTLYDWQNT